MNATDVDRRIDTRSAWIGKNYKIQRCEKNLPTCICKYCPIVIDSRNGYTVRSQGGSTNKYFFLKEELGAPPAVSLYPACKHIHI